MTTYGEAIEDTLIASVDLSANQYMLVTEAGAIPAAGLHAAGVQQDGGVPGEGPLSGQPVRIIRAGVSKVVTNGSAILAGSALTAAGTTGKVKLSAAGTDLIIGFAIEANGSTDNRVIRAMIGQAGAIA